MSAHTAPTPLPPSTIGLMALACGCAVSTLYYSQPLLPQMGASFDRSAAQAGWVATLTQLGYAAGLFLFVPLGDRLDRKRLILTLLSLNMAALAAVALAPSFSVLVGASLGVGLTAVTAQVVIPAVSGMVEPARRGQATGWLLSGLSSGLLFARTISGLVGAHAGWRPMFGLAMAIDVLLMAIIWTRLPRTPPTTKLAYPALLSSLWTLMRTQPTLRAGCATGFLMFGAFSALWGSLAAMVARPPYELGADAAGAFGFVGIIGVLASPHIGRAVDRFGPNRMLVAGTGLMAVAFAVIGVAALHLVAIVVAIALADMGNRTALLANQNRVYALVPDARSRLNTVFMTAYFLGGAAGTGLAAWASGRYGWTGLAVTGASFALAALAIHALGGRRPCA